MESPPQFLEGGCASSKLIEGQVLISIAGQPAVVLPSALGGGGENDEDHP